MTPHFSFAEMTFSETAVRHGFSNIPDPEQLANLTALAERILEPARSHVGPIKVTSGFRCPSVNALVGGAPSSQHMKGEAADLVTLNLPLREFFLWLVENADFDQLIWEYGRWVHVSHSRIEPGRRQILAAFRLPRSGTIYRTVATAQQAFDAVEHAVA